VGGGDAAASDVCSVHALQWELLFLCLHCVRPGIMRILLMFKNTPKNNNTFLKVLFQGRQKTVLRHDIKRSNDNRVRVPVG
jgi:hypothetical protein